MLVSHYLAIYINLGKRCACYPVRHLFVKNKRVSSKKEPHHFQHFFLTVTMIRNKVIYTGMFPVGDTRCRTLIDVCVCVCVCLCVCPPT